MKIRGVPSTANAAIRIASGLRASIFGTPLKINGSPALGARLVTVGALIAMVLGQTAWADTAESVWNGAATGWSTSSDWAPNTVPGSSQSAVFNTAFTNQPILTAVSTAQGIWVAGASNTTGNSGLTTISGAEALTISGNATLDGITNAGILLDGAGNNSLTLASSITSITLSNATSFLVNNGGTLTVNASVNNNGKVWTLGSDVPGASGGSIILDGGDSGAGPVFINDVFGSTSVTLKGAAAFAQTGLTTVNAGTLNLQAALSGGGAVAIVGSTGNLVENSSGVISGASTLTVSNANAYGGSATLSGANTYTGATAVDTGGSLTLDFSQSASPSTATNIINNSTNSSALTLGGGILTIKGGGSGATNSQQFASTTLTANTASAVAVNQNGATTANLTLNTFTYNTGATVDFTLPSSGSITVGNTTFSSGASSGYLLTSAATDGLAFATANGGTTWATLNTTTGAIGALSSYQSGNSAYGTATNNIDVGASGAGGNGVTDTPASSFTVNTLRFNTPGATLNLAGTDTIASGGILVTAASDSLGGVFINATNSGTILRAGTYNGSSGAAAFSIVNDGLLTIGSNINLQQDSGKGTTLIISATPGQSGTTIINGPLSANAQGLNLVITNPGQTIFNGSIAAGATSGGQNITIVAGNNQFNGSSNYLGTDTLTVSGGSTVFNGAMTSSAATPVVVTGGALALNAANNFTGAGNVTLSNAGILTLGNSSALPSTSAVVMTGLYQNTSYLPTAAPQLVFASNTAVSLAELEGAGQNNNIAVYLDVASGGAAQTQTFGSLYETQANSLFLYGGGNATSGTPQMNVTGSTYYYGNVGKGNLIAPFGANVALQGSVFNDNTGGTTPLILDGVTSGNSISGAVVNNGTGLTELIKANVSTWTLSNSGNTFTGGVAIWGGTLGLNFSSATANILPSGTALTTLYGSLVLTGNATTASSQTLGAVTIGATSGIGGADQIQLNNTSGVNLLLALGTVTRSNAGATIDFTLPTGTQGASNGVTTTSANASSGILGTWATVNSDSAFATVSSGNITAYTPSTTLPATGGVSTTVYSLSSQPSGAQTGNTAFAALDISDSTSGDSLNLGGHQLNGGTAGAILYAPGGTASYTISDSVGGGYISSSTDLILDTAANATLTISAQVLASGNSAAVTKSGAGTLVLSNAGNSYTGLNYINQGILSVSNLGSGGVGNSNVGTNGFVINGGTLQYTGGQVSTSRSIAIGGNGATIDAEGTGALTLTASPTFANGVGTAGVDGTVLILTGASTYANTFAGVISNLPGGNGGAPLMSLVKNGSGTWYLGAANYYQGPTIINGGELALNGAGTFGAYSLASDAPFTVTGGGIADFGATTNSLFGEVNLTNGTIRNGTVTASDGFDVQQGTVSAVLAGSNNNAGLTKTSANTVTLSANNTFGGATNVDGGTLIVSGKLSGSGAVTVSAATGSATLGGGGTIAGATTVGINGILAPGATLSSAGTTLTINNNVALNAGSTLAINLDATSNQVDLLQVNGNLTLAGNDTLTVSVLNGAASQPSYEIAAFTGTLSGTFANVNIPANYQINYGLNGAAGVTGEITLTAVPEPETWAMMIAGAGMLVLLRRRKAGRPIL